MTDRSLPPDSPDTSTETQSNTPTPAGRAQQALRAGDAASAFEMAERVLREAPGDPAQRRVAGMVSLEAAYRLGRLEQVLAAAPEVLALLREGGALAEKVDMLRLVSMCAGELGNMEAALTHAQDAHLAALESGDATRLSLALNTLACYFERAGDAWQAERLMTEALALARTQPLEHALFIALNNLVAVLVGMHHLIADAGGDAAAMQAPLLRAEPIGEEALALARRVRSPFPLVCALGNLAETRILLGRMEAATPLLDEGEAMAQRLGHEGQVTRFALSRGEWHLRRDEPRAAIAALLPATTPASGAVQAYTRMRAHRLLARAHEALDELAQAHRHLSTALSLDRARTTEQLRAQSALFVTRMEAEQARRDVLRYRRRVQNLEAAVNRDALTGLGNRRELALRLPLLIDSALAGDAPVCVAMLDLDHFKRINDCWGHGVGDRVLVALAAILRTHVRERDLLVRMGGEEFLLALPNTRLERAREICERLREHVQRHDWSTVAEDLAVTLSVGLAVSPPYDADALTERADAALYEAKAEGRNRVAVAPEPPTQPDPPAA